MNNIHLAEQELASIFELITGEAPKVTIVGRNDRGRPTVVVCYRGNELVRAMQIEAYVVGRGETIRHRSQLKDGNTLLVYHIEKTT